MDMNGILSNMLSGTTNNTNSELLQNQQITQQQINDLLQESSTLICGPSCQREKITKELEQKYLDAQTNLKTAPDQLERSKKNYYVYTRGETFYNEMQEQELIKKAKQIGETLTTLFNDELRNSQTMNSYLNTATINSQNSVDLLESYLKENEELIGQLSKSQSDIVTNDRKTFYETEAIDNLNLWYILFWRSYYFLYVILMITLVMTKNYKFLAIFSVLLLFYPYYISLVTKWIYNQWMKFINKLPSNVYNNL